MFSGNDLHWRFYYVDRQWKSIFTGGLQLPACKNDDFYWPLALAVTKNVTVNMFRTVSIELLCTSENFDSFFSFHMGDKKKLLVNVSLTHELL
jgi:hypothetical protein